MRKVMIGLMLFAIVSCTKQAPENNTNTFTLQYFNGGIQIETPAQAYATASRNFDVNADSIPDLQIQLEKRIYPSDSSFSAIISPATSIPQNNNSFEVIIEPDTLQQLNPSNLLFKRFAAKFYSEGQVLNTLRQHNHLVYLYKLDDYDQFKPRAEKYIAFALKKDEIYFFGWMQLEIEKNIVVVKRIAFCKNPNRKIKAGQVN